MGAHKVTGLAEFKAQLTNHKAARAALLAYLDDLGRKIVAEIKARCPSVTGALRASVRHEVMQTAKGVELLIHIGDTTAHYAGFVEYGTAHEEAKPFVRPVINAHRAAIPAEIAAVLSDTTLR
jgi:HK97 gp10 family phage protein